MKNFTSLLLVLTSFSSVVLSTITHAQEVPAAKKCYFAIRPMHYKYISVLGVNEDRARSAQLEKLISAKGYSLCLYDKVFSHDDGINESIKERAYKDLKWCEKDLGLNIGMLPTATQKEFSSVFPNSNAIRKSSKYQHVVSVRLDYLAPGEHAKGSSKGGAFTPGEHYSASPSFDENVLQIRGYIERLVEAYIPNSGAVCND